MSDSKQGAALAWLRSSEHWSPYVGGVVLGIVLVGAFYISGQGLGASGPFGRLTGIAYHAVAPEHTEQATYWSRYFGEGKGFPLQNWLSFLAVGVILGGLASGLLAGRFRSEVLKGPRISAGTRLGLALAGGVLVGFAARMAHGCTSGQGLSGAAVMSLGSWIFLMSMFAGGYALAWFVRKEWI
jgi:hypothetical protein